jgi:hypothetical protein
VPENGCFDILHNYSFQWPRAFSVSFFHTPWESPLWFEFSPFMVNAVNVVWVQKKSHHQEEISFLWLHSAPVRNTTVVNRYYRSKPGLFMAPGRRDSDGGV